MRKYVKEHWQHYLAGLFDLRLKYVRSILEGAEREADEEHLVLNGTEALVKLSLEREPGEFIPIEEIYARSGIEERQSKSAGLWPWLEREAKVVEKGRGSRVFRIRSEFWEAMVRLFAGPSYGVSRRSILELEGLGKEIWQGIDAKEYVDRERASWNG